MSPEDRRAPEGILIGAAIGGVVLAIVVLVLL